MPNPQLHDPNKESNEPLLTPIPYSRSGLNTKLLMLFAMLGMVVYAMFEAGKPENWEWMGFEKQPDISIAIEGEGEGESRDAAVPANDSEVAEYNPSAKRKSDANRSGAVGKPPSSANARITIIREQDSAGSQAVPAIRLQQESLGAAGYPVAAIRFWEQAYRDLSQESRQALMRTLKQIRTAGSLSDKEIDAAKQAVVALTKKRREYHQELFDQLTLTPDKATNKRELSERYNASEDKWKKEILPSLVAKIGKQEVTAEWRQAIVGLQAVLDQLAYAEVKDRTTVGWNGDSIAWTRLWEKILHENATGESTTATPVERIQLISQPDFYRGKRVAIEGVVLSGRKEVLKSTSSLGLEYYYVLWMRPTDSGVGPYCLYTAKLPESFPVLGEEFQDLDQLIQAKAIFFKVRSFVAVDSSVAYGPVLLTSNIESLAAAKPETVTREGSAIPWGYLLPAILGLSLMSGGIAWIAFRTTEVDSYQPGQKTRNRIEASLDELKDDSNIETDLERVKRLAQTLNTPD